MISVLASVVESNASSLSSSLSGNLSSNLSALSNGLSGNLSSNLSALSSGLSGNLSILSGNLSVLSPYPLQPAVPAGSNFSGGNGSGSGAVGAGASQDGGPVFPAYIRTTSMVLCIIILGIGVVGNIMVPIVILKTKDMRNSTNIFLTNLSIADLMVLLVCTPTVLVEVNSKPETWVLGEEMCKAVPFVELTVAHASVLTILAISFERYYAICEPLKAGYVCTKTRALIICLLAWALAALFTSPILTIAEYHTEMWYDSTFVAVCLTQADTFWRAAFFITSISAFFFLPLFILIVLYSIIARHLMSNPGIVAPAANTAAVRYRRQVVAMLATVVLSFFVCLLPFRAFTLLIILTPPEVVMGLGAEKYYNVLFFCRIMFHLNSAVNPILYNLMSTKFREGFRNICCCKMHRFNKRRRSRVLARKSTFTTTTLTNTSSSQKSKSSSSEGYLLKKSVVKMISFDDTCSASLVLEDSLTTKIRKFSTGRIPLNKLQESYV